MTVRLVIVPIQAGRCEGGCCLRASVFHTGLTMPAIRAAPSTSPSQRFGLKALLLRAAGGFEFAVEQSFGDVFADSISRELPAWSTEL